MPHTKYSGPGTKVPVLVPSDLWEGPLREDVKSVFNDLGVWATPTTLPVDSRQKVVCAIFTPLQYELATGGKKNYRGFVGRDFRVENVRYVVFPEPSGDGSLVGDADKFEAAVRLVLAVQTDSLKVEVINSVKKLDEAIAYIKSLKYVVADFETHGLDPHEEGAKVLSLAAGNKDRSYVLALYHKDSRTPESVIRKWLQAVASSNLVGHNIKYELRWFKSLGYDNINVVFDPMVAHHLLDENSLHDLDTLAGVYTGYAGYKTIIYNALLDRHDYETAPLDVLLRYNGLDVVITDLVMQGVYRDLSEDPALLEIYRTLDLPLIQVLADAEGNGYAIDKEELQRLIDWYERKGEEAQKSILAYRPLKPYFDEHPDFNFNSAPQKVDLLFNHMKLQVVRRTDPSKKFPNGQPSTDADTIKVLRGMGKHKPVLDAFLVIAKCKTMLSSFLRVFEKKTASAVDGMLRTSYNQHIVETFRLSSSGPNLQNPPRSEDLIKEGFEPIKGIFTSRFEGGVMLQADLSQIELRISAMYSGDEPLVRAYRENRDIHGEMAERVYGPGYDKEQRYKAKRANFSAEFDISPAALADQINSTEEEAKRLIAEFRKLHATLYTWFDALWEKAQADGYTTNFLGRRRHIKGELDLAYERYQRDGVRRAVWNFPIQSSAADIMKRGLIIVSQELQKAEARSLLVGTIHDSIILDTVPEETDWLARLIKWTFEEEIPRIYEEWITVPVRIDVSSGPDLHDLKEYKF